MPSQSEDIVIRSTASLILGKPSLNRTPFPQATGPTSRPRRPEGLETRRSRKGADVLLVSCWYYVLPAPARHSSWRVVPNHVVASNGGDAVSEISRPFVQGRTCRSRRVDLGDRAQPACAPDAATIPAP